MSELWALGAFEAAALIRNGELTSEALVGACLARIEALEDTVGAWAFLDPDYALKQAQGADAQRRAGRPLGPLHGVPVGIKDIFDTADMPTEFGTPLHAGRQPAEDATVVARLREAGAVIMGKTVTTELAVYAPGKTRNPHDPARTPGGSSSGSAAAVAAQMVPLAVGTQTNGSIIRPAAFCGTVGFKPSFGAVPRHRVLLQSRFLDHVGVFARSVVDAALVAETVMGYDVRDPDTRPRARPPLVETAEGEPALPPHFAFVRTPLWDQVEPVTAAAFEELVEALGEHVHEMTLAPEFGRALEAHRTIMEADLALNFARDAARGGDTLSAQLRRMIADGGRVLAVDYNHARSWRAVLNTALGDVFDLCDAILTPAAPGPAPLGLESTGSPVFCTLWTLCGTPAITLPLLADDDGMPIGVQLVAPVGDDARLLRTARWLAEFVAAL